MDGKQNRREFLASACALAALTWTTGARADEASTGGDPGPWRIGCYTRPWGQYDYREALDAIAEAGYRHAGLMTADAPSGLVISMNTTEDEAVAVGEACEQRGLAIPSVWGGGFAVEESLEAGIEGLRALLRNCAACGGRNLLVGGTANEDLQERYYRAIAEVCEYAEELGVGMSVKPHGGGNATGPECRAIVQEVGHPSFGLWYDPGNIFYYSDGEIDPAEDAEGVGDVTVGMSVKDYAHPREVALTPGTGQVDFPEVLRKLWDSGFTGGPLVVETLAPGSKEELLAEAVKARAFLEALTAGLGA